MTFPTIADMRERFPEFTVDIVSDVMMQMYLDDTEAFLSKTAFGTCYNRAAMYYTAHRIALAVRATKAALDSGDGVSPTASAGGVSGSSAGGLSISFASYTPASINEAWYMSTPYGTQFMQIASACISRIDIAGSAYPA